MNVETEAILVNNEVDFSEFTRDVINCLPKGEWKIDPEEVKRYVCIMKSIHCSLEEGTLEKSEYLQ